MRITTKRARGPNKDIGISMKAHRNSLGLGLRDYAMEAGVDFTCVWRLENGKDVRLSQFRKLSRKWGFPFSL